MKERYIHFSAISLLDMLQEDESGLNQVVVRNSRFNFLLLFNKYYSHLLLSFPSIDQYHDFVFLSGDEMGNIIFRYLLVNQDLYCLHVIHIINNTLLEPESQYNEFKSYSRGL
jgi:hypothetical protein